MKSENIFQCSQYENPIIARLHFLIYGGLGVMNFDCQQIFYTTFSDISKPNQPCRKHFKPEKKTFLH